MILNSNKQYKNKLIRVKTRWLAEKMETVELLVSNLRFIHFNIISLTTYQFNGMDIFQTMCRITIITKYPYFHNKIPIYLLKTQIYFLYCLFSQD